MTKYREILRLHSMNLSQVNIAASCGVSKKTVNKVLKAAREQSISWPIDDAITDAALEERLFPKKPHQTDAGFQLHPKRTSEERRQ